MEKDLISSSKNEKIKTVSALLKSKKARDEHGAFVIEGIRLFRDTLKTAPEFIESVYVSESFSIKNGDNYSKDYNDTFPIYTVKDSVFEETFSPKSSSSLSAVT